MTSVRLSVSGLRNRTHVLYAVSWIRHFIASTGLRASLVEVGSHRRIADECCRPDGLARGLELVEHRSAHAITDGPHYLVCIGAPANKTLARLRLTEGRGRLRIVVIDEGIGSFASFLTRRHTYRRQGGAEPWASIRAGLVHGSRRLVPHEPWALYIDRGPDGSQPRWALNEAFADEFRRYELPRKTQNTVVYLSQPWVDLGCLSAEDYLRHLEAVAAAVAPSGLRFLVRPHPTETIDRYRDFDVLEPALPAEIDGAVTAAQLVIGETSTALVNLAAVHRVGARRVIGPLSGVRSLQFSRRQEALFRSFVGPPTTISELASLL